MIFVLQDGSEHLRGGLVGMGLVSCTSNSSLALEAWYDFVSIAQRGGKCSWFSDSSRESSLA